MATERNRLLQVTPSQEVAIDALLSGATHAEAAQAAGVHRVTVTRWVNHHPGFQASLNGRLGELRDRAQHRLRSTLLSALGNISAHVEAGDYGASLAIIKVVGLDPALSPVIGPKDAEAILNAEASRRVIDPLSLLLSEADGLADTRRRARADVEAEHLAVLGAPISERTKVTPRRRRLEA